MTEFLTISKDCSRRSSSQSNSYYANKCNEINMLYKLITVFPTLDLVQHRVVTANYLLLSRAFLAPISSTFDITHAKAAGNCVDECLLPQRYFDPAVRDQRTLPGFSNCWIKMPWPIRSATKVKLRATKTWQQCCLPLPQSKTL